MFSAYLMTAQERDLFYFCGPLSKTLAADISVQLKGCDCYHASINLAMLMDLVILHLQQHRFCYLHFLYLKISFSLEILFASASLLLLSHYLDLGHPGICRLYFGYLGELRTGQKHKGFGLQVDRNILQSLFFQPEYK